MTHNTTKRNGRNFWVWAGPGCAGLILAGATSWLAHFDTVSRDEMIAYVQKHAPWVIDRNAIQLQVNNNTAAIGTLTKTVQALVTEQRVLLEKINQVIDKRDK